jgi:acyl carrier protein
MKNLISQIEEIFEVDALDLKKQLMDLDEWDSLAVLTILALLDSDYGMNMTQKELEEFSSIGAFVEYVEKNAK